MKIIYDFVRVKIILINYLIDWIVCYDYMLKMMYFLIFIYFWLYLILIVIWIYFFMEQITINAINYD